MLGLLPHPCLPVAYYAMLSGDIFLTKKVGSCH